MTSRSGSDEHSEVASHLHESLIGAGELTPLFVLHGWGQTSEIMVPLGERLALSRPVHLVDLPGFGKSPQPEKPWGTYDYAKCLIAHLDRKGLDEISVLGHSFGGRISLQLASKWPDRIRDVVLIASAGLPPIRKPLQRVRISSIRAIGKLFASLPTRRGEELRSWHRDRFGSSDYKNAGALRRTFVKTVTEDQSDNASKIQQPTLLLWGDADTETPINIAQRLHGLITNSTLTILPGRGHYPFLENDVHLCAEIVNEFLTKQDL